MHKKLEDETNEQQSPQNSVEYFRLLSSHLDAKTPVSYPLQIEAAVFLSSHIETIVENTSSREYGVVPHKIKLWNVDSL